MAERLRAIWERIRDDIHRNPGLWIGLGISAVILVIAYLAYRKQQLNNSSVVPANGYGIPDYGTSSGGSSGGLTYPGYSPYQPASPSLPISPVSLPTTSFTSPQTAFPAFPTFSLTPAAPSLPFPAFTAPTPTISGKIQNPLAIPQQQHTGTYINSGLVTTSTLNRTVQTQTEHTGTTTTYKAAPTTSYVIPTTIRTQPTYAGRVA